MNHTTLLVILLGILASTQTHLAKALERQGIETWDMLRARLKHTGEQIEGRARKPFIYILGLALNHTTFVYHLLVAPLGGTIAPYAGMYGVGLVVLLAYSTRVMKEEITRLELAGALSILAGSLVIGLESIFRPELDMSMMDLRGALASLVLLLALAAVGVLFSLKNGSPNVIGAVFGLVAGCLGSMDPILKGIGQTVTGVHALPGNSTGWVIFLSSFLVGEMAVLVTQWAYIKQARANVLVPALNCSYIGLPVFLQAAWMPGYKLFPSTFLGLGLIMGGIVLMRLFRETPDITAARRLPTV
jgi:drug/metabolite transporter superfamily protein YnfA